MSGSSIEGERQGSTYLGLLILFSWSERGLALLDERESVDFGMLAAFTWDVLRSSWIASKKLESKKYALSSESHSILQGFSIIHLPVK